MVRGVGSVTLVTLLDIVLVAVHTHPREDVLDHVVTLQDARTAAQDLPEREKRLPGCGTCTTEELHYCLGDGVIRDHCCCDGSFLEPFPYAPHTCLLAPVCTPIARDCEYYARIRVCCCDRVTVHKWRSLLFSSSVKASTSTWLLATVLLLLFKL